MSYVTMEPSGIDLMNALTTLYENRKCSDLTVYCRGRTYPVHRAVLRARSDFFDGACRNPFKESQRGWIDLSEDDPEAVEHMINYFYNSDYLVAAAPSRARHTRAWSTDSEQPQTPSLSSTPSSPLSPTPTSPSTPTFSRQHQRRLNLSMVEDPLLAVAADNVPKAPEQPLLSKFGVNSPLVSSLDQHWLLAVKQPAEPAPVIDTMIREDFLDTDVFDEEEQVPDQPTDYANAHLVVHAKVYAIAEQYGIKGLKTLAKKKYAAQITHHREDREFAASLPEIYDGTVETDRGIRDIVVATFRRFPELAQERDVEAVVRDTPALAWDLFRLAWGLPV